MSMNETQEEAWVCGHMDGMLGAGPPEAKNEYLFAHPVLLSMGALKIIQDARGDDGLVAAAIQFLAEARAHYWEHPEEYPIGSGPLEGVVERLRAGDIDFDEALANARAQDCAGQLSHTYMRAVMLNWVDTLDEDITFALQAAEIGLESALAVPLPRLALDVHRAAAEGFIRLAHAGLMRRPDGHIYARALDIGSWAVEDAVAGGRLPLKGEYLHMLGTMALDAYAANFGPTPDFPHEIEVWLGRAVNPMPKPVEGLGSARSHLKAAVELRDSGSERGRTLKALLETEVYLKFAMGHTPDPTRVSDLAERALAELKSSADDLHVQRLIRLKNEYGRA